MGKNLYIYVIIIKYFKVLFEIKYLYTNFFCKILKRKLRYISFLETSSELLRQKIFRQEIT